MSALNRGNIYRFLAKPFRNDTLIQAVEESIAKYHENIYEKETLDKTLKGVIKLLLDILSVVNKSAFEFSADLRIMLKDIADSLYQGVVLFSHVFGKNNKEKQKYGCSRDLY